MLTNCKTSAFVLNALEARGPEDNPKSARALKKVHPLSKAGLSLECCY